MRSAVLTAGGAGLATVLGLGLVTVVTTTGAAAVTCQPSTLPVLTAASPGPSTATPGGTSPIPGLPAEVGAYGGEQIANAAEIVVAGQRVGVAVRAQVIAVMTAIGESSLRNLDQGDAAGPDSRGLFQQRDNGAWGTYTDRMTPRIAATNFYLALLAVRGWESMAPTQAAHTVQRNRDPEHYERFWPDAVAIVAALIDDPDLASKLPTAGSTECTPVVPGTLNGPGGTFPAEACSVVPDPTTGRGCLTPRMLNIATQLQAQGWSLSCWDAHAWNPTSDHPLGRACDVFPGRGGRLPTGAEKAAGDQLAATLQATAATTGVSYLIWYGRVWSVDRNDEGWRPYSGGGVYDPGDITGGHYDHIHISLR